MCASSEDKDFVHVPEKKYKEINPSVIINPISIADWEASHWNYDLAKLDQYFIVLPDLVIIRLGENVQNPVDFDDSLSKLITYIKSKSTNTKFLITGSFWGNSSIESQINSVTAKNNFCYVKLDYLNTKKNVSRIGAKIKDLNGNFYYVNQLSVANHPGDIGMSNIAALIYNELITYKF